MKYFIEFVPGLFSADFGLFFVSRKKEGQKSRQAQLEVVALDEPTPTPTLTTTTSTPIPTFPIPQLRISSLLHIFRPARIFNDQLIQI